MGTKKDELRMPDRKAWFVEDLGYGLEILGLLPDE